MSEGRYDIIIIGSGLGGLISAAILLKEGYSVCVLEKNRIAGGCLQSFEWKGRTFNTGVHYFGGLDEGSALHPYWKYLGLTDSGIFEKMNPEGFDIVCIDDWEFRIAAKEKFTESLLPSFPHSGKKIEAYLQRLDEITKDLPLYNLSSEIKEFPSYRSESAVRFFREFADEDDLLPAVLSGNNFLYGGDENEVSLYTAAVINHSFISGAWRVRGGSSRITDHLISRIRENGGNVLTGREVIEITFREKLFFIRTSHETFISDSVISDIHPALTIRMLNGIKVRKSFSERIISLENTSSVFQMFIALKTKTFPHLGHNIHYHGKNGSFMFYTTGEKEWATGAVVMKRDNEKNYKRWENTFTGTRDEEYNGYKKTEAEQLLNLIEEKFPGFRQHIEDFIISTPLTWRDHTGTPGGSMFGIKRTYRDPLTSWVSAKTPVPGLYFTGQNTNIHGVTGVTIGAVQTCAEFTGLPYLLNKIRNV